jgi:hypothetical protein
VRGIEDERKRTENGVKEEADEEVGCNAVLP